MKITSPSRVALQAVNRAPVGTMTAKHDGRCAFCGHGFSAGNLVVPFTATDSFTDYGAMKEPTSKWLCGWCAGTWNADFTSKALKSVMCADGVFSAASNADIAYWITNPPEGEWIWVMGDQKRQHIVWRATVNTSQKIFQVRNGELNLTIRRANVFTALDAAMYLAHRASVGRKGAALKSPFIRLSRDLDESVHGMIRDDLHELGHGDENIMEAIEVLQSCTPGELWALTALLYAEPSQVRPKQLLG